MTTIIIKSFNRPHYLDRCLHSIYLHVKGSFEIKIVDDGTPNKYLIKLQQKYPEIKIQKSKNYDRKVIAIEENLRSGKLINGFEIPINDWKQSVEEAQDYVLMTEDDVWFTSTVDIDSLVSSMKNHNTSLLKLGWISNRPIKSPIIQEENEIQFIKPHLLTGSRYVMNCILKNKFKIYSLLYRLGIMNKESKNEYWILNALLMGLYDKNYWLFVWSTLHNKVDEMEQVINASIWYNKYKSNNYLYGKLKKLVMNTTFQSSATTSYHEHYDIQLDINKFNYLLNEEWYHDKLDVISDLPKDIKSDRIIEILDHAHIENCSSDLWIRWTNKFKEQYIKQDVNVD